MMGRKYGAGARGAPRLTPSPAPRLSELPRGPRPPTLGPLRAARPARAPRSGLATEPLRQHPFPDPPDDWQDGTGEWAIYWAHAPLGRGEAGGVWLYRVPFGGSFGIAGFVPDFLELDLGVSIDVYGRQELSSGDPGATIVLREAIMQHLGALYRVIDEPVAIEDPIGALRRALAGQSTSQYQ